MRRLLLLTATLAFLARTSAAIELSLEENRAERGSIGYIDMQRLFKTFPDTVRAKENFEEVVRQAEEQINLRKAEILRLRNELSQLKIEREFIARNPVVEISSGPPAPPASPAPEAQQPPAQPPQPSPAVPLSRGQAVALAALPGLASTDTAKASRPEPLTINIPGVSTAPIVVQPPQPQPQAPPAANTAVSTSPAPSVPSFAASPPLNAALVEIDAKIAVKARDLAQKESDFKDQQAAAEKNLLDLEGRKTEILLGKIYKAVQQVARKEGVSVVVDKGSILYGHDAVDITEKVLRFLRGEQ